MKKLFTAMFAALALWSCDGILDPDPETAIEVENESALTQTLFANQTQGSSYLTFTTTGAWSSSAVEIISGGTRADLISAPPTTPADWLWLDPASGDGAGEYTVSICADENTTGAVRRGVITISCEGESVRINVTQKSEEGEFDLPVDIDEISDLVRQALDNSMPFYQTMLMKYDELDLGFSLPYERENLMPESEQLWSFWETAYEVIELSNIVIQYIDDADMSDRFSDAEKGALAGRAELYRGMAYLYLSTLFGQVPITTERETPWTELPAGRADEIAGFMFRCFDSAMEMLPQEGIAEAGLGKMLAAMQQPRQQEILGYTVDKTRYYQMAADVFRELVQKDAAVPLFDNLGSDSYYLPAQIYMLGIEAILGLGDENMARDYMTMYYNRVLHQPELPDWDILYLLQYNSNVHRIIWMNKIREGEADVWENKKTLLMPIPLSAMSQNERLMQNPGW